MGALRRRVERVHGLAARHEQARDGEDAGQQSIARS